MHRAPLENRRLRIGSVGQPQLGFVIWKLKRGGHNADDRERLVIENDALPGRGLPPKIALPKLVAHNGDTVCARLIVLGKEDAALGCLRSQQREDIRGHVSHTNTYRLILSR